MSAGSLPAANGSAAPQSGVELPEGDEVTGRIVSELPYGYLVEAKVGNHKFSGVLYHSDGEGNAALASNATPESVSKGGSDAAANGGAIEQPEHLAAAIGVPAEHLKRKVRAEEHPRERTAPGVGGGRLVSL